MGSMKCLYELLLPLLTVLISQHLDLAVRNSDMVHVLTEGDAPLVYQVAYSSAEAAPSSATCSLHPATKPASLRLAPKTSPIHLRGRD